MLKNKSSLTVIKSDIFQVTKKIVTAENIGSSIVIPHVCNNVGLFGAGFASAVRKNFPTVAANFELLGKKTKLGYVQYISVMKDKKYDHELIVANMIAQNGIMSPNNSRPINYEALVKCMVDIRNHIKNLNKEKIEIHCPKFGSGLAGGDWGFIENLIEDIWRDYTVLVYKI